MHIKYIYKNIYLLSKICICSFSSQHCTFDYTVEPCDNGTEWIAQCSFFYHSPWSHLKIYINFAIASFRKMDFSLPLCWDTYLCYCLIFGLAWQRDTFMLNFVYETESLTASIIIKYIFICNFHFKESLFFCKSVSRGRPSKVFLKSSLTAQNSFFKFKEFKQI